MGINSAFNGLRVKRLRLDAFDTHTVVCSVGTGSSFCGVSLLGNEADCLSPSRIEIKKVRSHTSTKMRPIFKAGCNVVEFKMENVTLVAL